MSELWLAPVSAPAARAGARMLTGSGEPAVRAATIRGMRKDRPGTKSHAERPSLPKDQSRLAMMAREKRMTVAQRVELFERLSRDAAWARSARRVR